MANSSKHYPSKYPLRSVSLPCRSHPSIIKIEQELNELKTWEASHVRSEKDISNGLIGLSTLYVSLNDLLDFSSTQEAISHSQSGECIDDLLDRSMRVLDICGSVREMVSQIKEHVVNLQCILRRRKGDLSIQSNSSSYIIFRKKTKKDAKRLLLTLKQIKSNNAPSLGQNLDHLDTTVIQIVIEVNEILVSVLKLILLSFTTLGLKIKPTRLSLVSKLMQNKVIDRDAQFENVYDMETVEVALLNIYRSNEGDKSEIAKERLMAFEVHVESIDKGLECTHRHLIRARVSLLNIASH